jgi:hypothetical protein
MRIWSIHPQYLDSKGLVALWREGLLAKHVLEGKTIGYKNHPQLKRFKSTKNPIDSINQYLSVVYDEAAKQGYHFSKNKINWNFEPCRIAVTIGQINYEIQHLLRKLKVRNKVKYHELLAQKDYKTHPLFYTVDGKTEDWEIVNENYVSKTKNNKL